jgi:predicted ATPase
MRLNRISVAGFKSIRELQELKLQRLNVLIGANGAGKSNLIGLFKVFNQMVNGNFQNFVRQQGGANAMLHFGQKTTEQITVQLNFGSNGYRCVWQPTVDDRLFFAKETCIFYGDQVKTFHEPLGTGHLESRLPEAAKARDVPRYVFEGLASWQVYHFHDTSDSALVKKRGALNDNMYLRPDAANLAAFLYRLQQTHPGHYETIRDTVRMIAPFFDDFILRPLPDNPNQIQLEWRERGSDYPFMAYHLSDGTLRFICLATLLLQPRLPDTVLIDEPELGLHPYAIELLGTLIGNVPDRAQLIIATQSVTLVNQLAPEDVLVVENRDHTTTLTRLEAAPLSDWLQEYALGELWEKNVLGGRPTR